MKLFFKSLLVLPLFLFCDKKAPADYAIISGVAKNSAPELILRKVDAQTTKEIPVAPDGSFRDTIRTGPGKYTIIFNQKGYFDLYLENGFDVQLEFDTDSISAASKSLTSLTANGAGSQYAQYLLKKQALADGLEGWEIFNAEEDSFKIKLADRKEKLIALLNSMDRLSEPFTKIEKKDIDYENRLYSVLYPSYHVRATGNMNFKPSEGYVLPHLSKEEISSDEDLSFSKSYNELIFMYLRKNILPLVEGQKIDYETAFLTVIKDFPPGAVRDHALVEFVSSYMKNVKDIDGLYNETIALCVSQTSKDEITHAYEEFKKLEKGKPSPEFSNYENAKGGVSSLKDFRGKYVYIDMWATWCVPCLVEIPGFKKLQESYKNNDKLVFMSISIDKKENREAWLAMIKEKQLEGVQLLADAEWQSRFARDYQINSIPRYIIIDPDGNIVNADAPRPSDPALLEAFKELKL